jgi:hypothetical protein
MAMVRRGRSAAPLPLLALLVLAGSRLAAQAIPDRLSDAEDRYLHALTSWRQR